VPDLLAHNAGGRAPPARALLAAALDIASEFDWEARGHVTIEMADPTQPHDFTRCFEAQEKRHAFNQKKHNKDNVTRKAKIMAEPVRYRPT